MIKCSVIKNAFYAKRLVKLVTRVLLKEAIDEFLAYLLVELNRSQYTCSGYQKDLNVFTGGLEDRRYGYS